MCGLCSAENFPVDLIKAARVGERKKTSDMDLSAAGQGITLMVPGTLWRAWLWSHACDRDWRLQPLLPVPASGMPLSSSQRS